MLTTSLGTQVGAAEAALTAFAIFAIIIATLFLMIYVILDIIALWRLFEKAGEKGWKAIVPIYNLYTYTKLVWDTKYFWILLIVSLVGSTIVSLDTHGETVGALGHLADLAVSVYGIVFGVIFSIKTAKSFGKGEGFAIGLIFLNLIFTCILAFGGAKYVGPEGKKPAKKLAKKIAKK